MVKFNLNLAIIAQADTFDSKMYLYTDHNGKRYVMSKADFTEVQPGEKLPETGAFIVDEMMLRGMGLKIEEAIGKPYAEQEAAARAPVASAAECEESNPIEVVQLREEVDNLKRVVAEILEKLAKIEVEKPKRTRKAAPAVKEEEPAAAPEPEPAASQQEEPPAPTAAAANPWA